MSETYLDCTAETVAAKRGRNVEQYKRKYDDATKLYGYIQSSIDELNNLMFQENSSTYAVLRAVMRYLEICLISFSMIPVQKSIICKVFCLSI